MKWAAVLLGVWIGVATALPGWTAEPQRTSEESLSETIRLGIEKANAGDLNQALSLFNTGLKASGKDPIALYNRGKVYLVQGHLDKARRDLDLAIKFAPDLAGAYVARGMAYRLEGDFSQAIKDFNKAAAIEPENVTTLINRAALFFDTGEHDKALEDLTRVINLNPRMVKALGNRAYILEQLGRYDEAVKDLSAIVVQFPDHLPALKHLGYVCRQSGDPKNALRWYRMALKIEEKESARKRLREEILELEAKVGR